MKIWMVLLGALYVGQHSFAGGVCFGWQDEGRDSSEGVWTEFGFYESGETLGVDQEFQEIRPFKLDLNNPQEKLVFDMCESVFLSGPSSENKTTIKQEKEPSKRGGRGGCSRQENLKHHLSFMRKENISKSFVPTVPPPERQHFHPGPKYGSGSICRACWNGTEACLCVSSLSRESVFLYAAPPRSVQYILSGVQPVYYVCAPVLYPQQFYF